MGLHRDEVVAAHRSYLCALAAAAWTGGVVTADERHDIETVAVLLGFDKRTAHEILDEQRRTTTATPGVPSVSVGGLRLRPGDTVVLTGQMCRGRSEIVAEASSRGLRVTTAVSRRTSVVVAKDPDSLSGKARTARSLGVPVVDEDTFLRVLADLS